MLNYPSPERLDVRTSLYVMLVCLLALVPACSDPPDEHANNDQEVEAVEPRPVIYQLVVRLFGNVKNENQYNGDLVTNGVGKFAHINDAALTSLKDAGATHIWLTGVPQQATATSYPNIGQPADDPDVLKGKAGSFFAIKDYFDVSPDYALDPAKRLEEFEALVDRIHDHDMKVVIDFVPNHVARTYDSDIKPELSFGADDDTTKFYDPQNNFFYLTDPPGQSLSLPNPDHWDRPPGADGTLEVEDNDGTPPGDVPRVTGNNQATASPSVNDWYETVKLNYGYDFTTGTENYDPIPDTWKKMDAVLAYWQQMGVDGFRCDFAHLVPLEAWRWLIEEARERDPDVYFFAEAYLTSQGVPGFSFSNMIQVGFDAVYDDASYDTVKGVFCCGRWASDLESNLPGDFLFDKSLRYTENHDERRIASPLVDGENPDDSGFGDMEAGKPVSTLLYLLGSGPILVYNGQMVGEPAAGVEGFSGDDGRTTIFDYWTMPRVAEWVNDHKYDGGQLSQDRKALRAWYVDLIELAQQPGFASGNIYVLQGANADSEGYTGGQWLFSFVRYDVERDVQWLVVANLSDQARETSLKLPREVLEFTEVPPREGTTRGTPALDEQAEAIEIENRWISSQGFDVSIPALTTRVYRLEWTP
jgi:glycosidase